MATELRQAEKNRTILKEMVNRKENTLCADCGRRRPRWASINLGVFICDTCAGVHRGIGVHITQVRSIDLDDWKNEWVSVMESMGGNIKANELYEAKNKNPMKTEVTNESFIKDKYVEKKWTGKAKAKKAVKKEESSESSEEEVKPKPKPKKAVAKKVESESEEEVKPKKKAVAKKVESSDSDSEAERPKSQRKPKKVEEAPKKKDNGFESLTSAGSGKSKTTSAPATTAPTRKPETASSTWDPFAQGVAPVQEQPGDEWSVFTTTAKPASQAASQAKPAVAASSWDAFGTDDATTGIAGLKVSTPALQSTQTAAPAKAAGPSKGDILGLFDQAPSGPQMGMGMGMGMGMQMGGMGMGMNMNMPGMQSSMGMGGGMPQMMPLMNPQQQQQYMMQQRMTPAQQQQFMMQQQHLMMMMMQHQQRNQNSLFPNGQPQQQQYQQQQYQSQQPSFF